VTVRAARGLRCAAWAVGRAAELAALAWGELRSNTRGESDHEARYARLPTGQASQPPQKSPPPGTAHRDSQLDIHSKVARQRRCCKGACGRAVARIERSGLAARAV